MDYFTPINAHVLLRTAGVYSEHQLYVNQDEEVFARKGNGYLRLMDHAATSKPKVFWSEFRGSEAVPQLDCNRHGRLTLPQKRQPQNIHKAA